MNQFPYKLKELFQFHFNRLNLKLEAWAEHLLKEPSNLQNISIFLAQSLTNTTELQKLTSGFLLKEILDRFTNKTVHPELDPDRALWMYFTNNAAIIDMLNSLGVFTVNSQFLCVNGTISWNGIIFFVILATPAAICIVYFL